MHTCAVLCCAIVSYLRRSTQGDLPPTMSYSVLRLLPCMAVENTSRKSCTHDSTPGFFMVTGGSVSYRSLSLSLRQEKNSIVLKKDEV